MWVYVDLDWGKCAVPACNNSACRRLRSRYCWPHTPGIWPGEIESALAVEEKQEEDQLRRDISKPRQSE